MGRKGTSKRKPSKTKSSPTIAAGKTSGSVTKAIQAAEVQTVKAAAPAAKGESKPTNGRKKNPM